MTLAQAQETFFYDDSDGCLYWKIRPSKNCRVTWGDVAGSHQTGGYRQVGLDRKNYRVHNIIWNWHHGEIPAGKEVDHIDKNTSNNRIENLRLADRVQQAIHTKARGFYKHKRDKLWYSSYRYQGTTNYLGTHDTALQARLAYEKATSALEPEFASTHFTDAFNRLITDGVA